MSGCGISGDGGSSIRLIGCDGGQTFHLMGEDAGAEGVEITKDGFDGLIEAQIRTVERTPVRMDGAILRAVKTEVLEATIELSVSSLLVDSTFEEVDSALREAFSFELDPWFEESTLARIEWETEESGVRWLDVALASTDYALSINPHKKGWWLWTIHVKAYTPFWQARPVPKPLVFTEPGSQTVEISNPTGVPMFHRWSGTVAQWELPDNSWSGKRWKRAPGGRYPDRRVLYPALTELNGGIVVDYDPSQLSVRDKNDTNLIAAMPVPGDGPRFCIPPFTQKQLVTVTAVAVPPEGAAIKLIQPRQYRRPWGRV